MSARDLDQERDDDCADDHGSGDRGGDDVDLAEALVAAVAAQAADRLASSAEQDQGTERDHDTEREEPGAVVATDPHRSQHRNPERYSEQRQEPPGLLICIEHLLDRDAEEAAKRKRERQ